MPVWLGWSVLALVLLDELLVVAAASFWGAGAGGGWLAVLAGLGVVVVWALFASPRAPYSGPVVRPVVKTVVLVGASGLVWAAGHPGWALALLVLSVVVNGLALLPSVQALVTAERGRPVSAPDAR